MITELAFPPGVYRNGTILQSRGRYYDSNLVRWYQGVLMPMGGWTRRGSATVTGVARAILNWSDNTLRRWTLIGTHSKLYVQDRVAAQSDITPSGFTAGSADGAAASAYGGGTYGSGYYGVLRADTGLIQEATRWQLDTFGENPIGCTPDDGKLYTWDLNTAHIATVISGAPTNLRGVVVTEESFIFCLGKDRIVTWCDQQDSSVWIPAATNQAGSYPLNTSGKLQCGRRIKGGTLIWTDIELYLAQYLGAPLVYSFERVASDCGVISSGSAVVANNMAVWMGQENFWVYDGYVKPLPSDVGDYVFDDLNRVQASKVFAHHNPAFGEISWFYPSSGASEVDRYCRWNYRENHWAIGALVRTCGAEQGVFANPFMVGSDGKIYEHESGFNYDSTTPYAESGPMEIAQGGNVWMARQLIPDERTLGSVTATFYIRLYPTATEAASAAYSLANPTDLRFTGREIRVRYTGTSLGDWRVGLPKIDVVEAGLR